MDETLPVTLNSDDDAPARPVFDLRVVFYDGHLMFTRRSPDEKFEDFRTFAYDKVAPYCGLEAFTLGEEEKKFTLDLHHTKTMNNPHWRMACWWQLELKLKYRPLLDQPFRELLGMLEQVHDAMNETSAGDTINFEKLRIPMISGVTKDVSIFALAQLYWSSRHLRIKAPLRWTAQLRDLLFQAINSVHTKGPDAAFRGIDFWYIWGAFRDFDEEVVDAMVTKLNEAIEAGCKPVDLDYCIIEIDELKERMEKSKEKANEKMGKMTWAQSIGGSMSGRRNNPPSTLQLGNKSNGRSKTFRTPKSATSFEPHKSPLIDVTNAQDDAPKTGPMGQFTILRKDRADSLTSQPGGEGDASENKKGKGEASTPPSGMAPPASAKGGGRGGGKKKGATWGGSKRGGKGRGAGGGGGSGWRD